MPHSLNPSPTVKIDADPSTRKCTQQDCKADPRPTRLTSSVSLSAISPAFPNNSTRRERITKALVVRVRDGILTLYDAPFQETCTRSSAENASLDYNSDDHEDRQI
ncbi:hypothetical protein SERLA73DRAFT_80493 [Serpula lacrymans var. lacrymans S7.3]|uniref:Uncharacterized protein n=1 Tax=Serpula lacrymans var. lacrymans (strain S7.3) TaxID=936435 RepID=F8QJU3_SERL3|nr:hypothetical protein SERLA73DRAFT_80493 [Serpula lacrymans var. lacrymans S7.3]